ncbi:MAG: hypothetical protein GY765_21705 [bacterium]|nr:hypothetical protein [bacterium]
MFDKTHVFSKHILLRAAKRLTGNRQPATGNVFSAQNANLQPATTCNLQL